MNINVSCTSNVNLKDLLEIDETSVERIFEDVVYFIFKNNKLISEETISKSMDKDYEEVEAGIYICDNKEIQELNSKYRDIDTPTDVLSFPMADDKEMLNIPVLHLGEIIISAEKLVEQAKENNHSFIDELIYLIAHGTLHLIGMHHYNDDKYKIIMEIQEETVTYIKEKANY